MTCAAPRYDSSWAITRLREVWEWVVAQKWLFVAYMLVITKLAFERDDGRSRSKPTYRDTYRRGHRK
jgi:hypothetical protein